MRKIVLATMTCSIALTSCASVRKQSYEVVEITSNPQGAHITIDGFDCGETPQAFEMATNRSHEISVEKQDFPPQNYLLKPQINGSKLLPNATFPVVCCGVFAAGATIALGSAAALSVGPVIILSAAASGLVIGGIFGLAGVGIDIHTGRAQTFPHESIHFNLE